MSSYQQHPLSAAFPSMSADAFAELRVDIAANGLHSPITLYEDKVLDGWHRYTCCQQTGTAPRFTTFQGDDAAARRFVVSVNLLRRHLDTSQRAMIAARFASIPQGRPIVANKGAISPVCSQTVAEAATLVNVGDRAVKDARVVLAQASPEVIAAVEAGDMSVSRAAKETRAATPRPVAPKPATPAPAPKPAPAPAPAWTHADIAPASKPQAPVFNLTPPPDPPAPSIIEIEPRTVEQWEQLTDKERAVHLSHRNPKASLNRQQDGEDDNSIDWAKWTWNPVTGCNHACPYCYARDIAERFSDTPAFPNGFKPTLRPERLSAPLNGRPRAGDDPRERRVFTGSMTDLFGRWVPAEWINATLDVIRKSEQWEFLMLTKFPKRMAEFDIPRNVWMGTSVDCQARVANAESAFERVNAKVKWLSVEPMIEPLTFKHLDRFDMIAIGGASRSSRTPQWIPPFRWIDDLMRQADDAGCAVFLKSNLYRKEQPNGPRYRFMDQAPEVFNYLRKEGA